MSQQLLEQQQRVWSCGCSWLAGWQEQLSSSHPVWLSSWHTQPLLLGHGWASHAELAFDPCPAGSWSLHLVWGHTSGVGGGGGGVSHVCVCAPVKPTRGYYVTTRGCAIEHHVSGVICHSLDPTFYCRAKSVIMCVRLLIKIQART